MAARFFAILPMALLSNASLDSLAQTGGPVRRADNPCVCVCGAVHILPPSGFEGRDGRSSHNLRGDVVAYNIYGRESVWFFMEGSAFCRNYVPDRRRASEPSPATQSCASCSWTSEGLLKLERHGCRVLAFNSAPDGFQSGWKQLDRPEDKPKSCRSEAALLGACGIDYSCVVPDAGGTKLVAHSVACPARIKIGLYPCPLYTTDSLEIRCRQLRRETEAALRRFRSLASELPSALDSAERLNEEAVLLCNLRRVHQSLTAAAAGEKLYGYLVSTLTMAIKSAMKENIEQLTIAFGTDLTNRLADAGSGLDDFIKEAWEKHFEPSAALWLRTRCSAARLNESKLLLERAREAKLVLERSLREALAEIGSDDFIKCCISCDLRDLRRDATRIVEQHRSLEPKLSRLVDRYENACAETSLDRFCTTMKN